MTASTLVGLEGGLGRRRVRIRGRARSSRSSAGAMEVTSLERRRRRLDDPDPRGLLVAEQHGRQEERADDDGVVNSSTG